MKTYAKPEILTFTSDAYAAIGLAEVLRKLNKPVAVCHADSLNDVHRMCERRVPDLAIFIFHENMELTGSLEHLLMLQHRYPHMRLLVLTKKLFPLFSGLSRHLSGLKVASLHAPLSEISWLITAGIVGNNSDTPLTLCADVMLPDRQLKILQLLSWSMTTDQVAVQLGITGKTANAHKLHALERLHIQNKSDIADLFAVADELRMVVGVLRYQAIVGDEGGEISTDPLLAQIN